MKTINTLLVILLGTFIIACAIPPISYAHDDESGHAHEKDFNDDDFDSDLNDEDYGDEDFEGNNDSIGETTPREENARERRKRKSEEARERRDSTRERRRTQRREAREIRRNRYDRF